MSSKNLLVSVLVVIILSIGGLYYFFIRPLQLGVQVNTPANNSLSQNTVDRNDPFGLANNIDAPVVETPAVKKEAVTATADQTNSAPSSSFTSETAPVVTAPKAQTVEPTPVVTPPAPVEPTPAPAPVPTVAFKLESSVFSNNEVIPKSYTCSDGSAPIPLKVSGVPTGTKSLAMIVEDPDAPGGNFVHWVVWNIPPTKTSFETGNTLAGAVVGTMSMDTTGWYSPCPPSGLHHYIFTVYALSSTLSLDTSAVKRDLVWAMEDQTIKSTSLTGLVSN